MTAILEKNGLSGIFGYMENRKPYSFFEFWQWLHSLSNIAEHSGYSTVIQMGKQTKCFILKFNAWDKWLHLGTHIIGRGKLWLLESVCKAFFKILQDKEEHTEKLI